MAEYILTFDDGSSAYLEHYGVPGMKWGVWNEETKARYAGAGNGTFYKKAQRGDKYGQAVTNQRRAYNANQPKPKQIFKNAIMTPMGAHAYNTARSRGLGRSESLLNVPYGPFYAQAVKYKQKKLGTTKAMVSGAARERSEYTKDESFKKTLAKNFLLSPAGVTAYNSVKARTKNRGKAALAGIGIEAIQVMFPGSTAYVNPGVLAATRAFGGENSDKQVDAVPFKRRSPKYKKKR